MKRLLKHKGSDTAIYFGCGPSINDITKDDWKILKKYDTWVSNWFLYHEFIVPNFYYLSIDKEHIQEFKKLFAEKRNKFDNTIFLSTTIHSGTIKRHRVVDKFITYKIHQPRTKAELRRKGINTLNDYKPMVDGKIYFYGNAHLTFLFALMWLMGYKEIILYGVDLNDRRYFWHDRKDVHWRWNRETRINQGKVKDPDTVHPSSLYMNFFLRHFTKKYISNVYVGNKKTLLYPDILQYKGIEELK